MPSFAYVAVDTRGKERRGNLAADSRERARAQLESKKLHVLRLADGPDAPAAAPKGHALFSRGRRKLSPKQLTVFTRQLATISEVSPLEEALRLIARQSEADHVRAIVGRVADDQLGQVFAHDIRAQGVGYATPVGDASPSTGRCLILVTDCGERTMNTYLGASHYLPMESIADGAIERARILYLEGYMWDPEEPRAVMREAIRRARAAGVTVAMTLSVNFIIELHRSDLQALIDGGLIDILFVNDEEVMCLTQTEDLTGGWVV